MPRENMTVTTRRCKRCRWSSSFSNRVPFGDPKLPDTWYCMNDHVSEIVDSCQTFVEPDNEEDKEE